MLRLILMGVSWLAILGTVVPAILFCTGQMELDAVKTTMLAATAAWFVITPFWMGQKGSEPATESVADGQAVV